MHKLIEYVCEKLEELEKKSEKNGELSMSEIQYADTLAHLKKNLMKAEEMSDDYSYNYSYADGSNRGGRSNVGGNRGGSSYARGRRNVRRDSMGRYSGNDEQEDMIDQLEDILERTHDQSIRKDVEKLITKLEQA